MLPPRSADVRHSTVKICFGKVARAASKAFPKQPLFPAIVDAIISRWAGTPSRYKARHCAAVAGRSNERRPLLKRKHLIGVLFSAQAQLQYPG